MTTLVLPTQIFILPDVAWACLLDPIARDAKPGAVIVTYTPAMVELCEQTLRRSGATMYR